MKLKSSVMGIYCMPGMYISYIDYLSPSEHFTFKDKLSPIGYSTWEVNVYVNINDLCVA
jgi:hypothetical protein